jgi:hypothetical protein
MTSPSLAADQSVHTPLSDPLRRIAAPAGGFADGAAKPGNSHNLTWRVHYRQSIRH